MFLTNLNPFLGDGSKNAKGQDLQSFLESYDPHKYDTPSVTTDILVLQVKKGAKTCTDGGKVLLIRRSNHPSIGLWALPGGFVDMKEDVLDGARRELQEETGVENVEIEPFGVYGDWQRDPRTRVITVPHLAILEDDIPVRAGDDAKDAKWFSVSFQKVHTSWENDLCTETYRLTLQDAENRICLQPVVTRTTKPHALLQQERFAVSETGGLAVDHSAILLQGLLYAEQALCRRDRRV